jgi:nucleotide-binding universal stress UspA family protein
MWDVERAMDVRRPQAGMVIDGFQLDQALDPGGMANFWRVSREGLAIPLVMKIPLLAGGDNPVAIVAYETEQMILARLTGPHVPRFIAAGDFEKPYIVMEFVFGRSLKSLLAATPLPASEVAAIGARIAVALHDIHCQHVLHLDLKPSNVMLCDNGEAVLIDFGLSHHEQLPDLVGEEIDGPVGTGPYIAPEQVLRDRDDPRSDLFALGVILYFLATGERPFGEPQRAREWKRRLWRDPLPPRRRNRNIPPWLQEIILRCLEVSPDARYATAAQLAFDLQHPDQVALTRRAERSERDGMLAVARRWLAAHRAQPLRRHSRSGLIARAPIIMAALDLAPGGEGLLEALTIAVRRLLQTEPSARLACVNVLRIARIALDRFEDEHGRNMHLQRLIELKHWARTLPVAPEQVTCHVLESPDPAAALADYARNNGVDHIVMGARSSSTLRRYLGSVSAQVVAEAPCTVTVVRDQTAARAERTP